jgi:hypothetical protein
MFEMVCWFAGRPEDWKKLPNFWEKGPKQLSIKKSTPKLNLKVKNICLKQLLKL